MSLASVPGTHSKDIAEPYLLEACYHLGSRSYFKCRVRFNLTVYINQVMALSALHALYCRVCLSVELNFLAEK